MLKLSEIVAELEILDPGKVYHYKPIKQDHCTVWQEDVIDGGYAANNRMGGSLHCSMYIVRFAPPTDTVDATAMSILGWLRDQGGDPTDTVKYYDDLDMVVHEIHIGDVIFDYEDVTTDA